MSDCRHFFGINPDTESFNPAAMWFTLITPVHADFEYDLLLSITCRVCNFNKLCNLEKL